MARDVRPDTYGLGIVIVVGAALVFLLYLFTYLFGTPMTQFEKEEYLKENWPQRYEKLKGSQKE